MKKKIVVIIGIIIILHSLIPLIFLVSFLEYFNYYDKPDSMENDKTILYISGKPQRGDYWEIECIPEDFVELLDEKYKSPFTYARQYWEFKAIKPGEFTLAYLSYYDTSYWIIPEGSFLEDYIVDENLEIHLKGCRPIYENEKYDKILFEHYVEQYNLHLEWELKDYPSTKYSLSGDYETKTINIVIYNSNVEDEADIKSIIENYLNGYFEVLGDLAADYKINITFE
jgi:hypothetical protein